MDGVRIGEMKTMLDLHFNLSADCVPTPDNLCMKLREYLVIKTRAQKRYKNFGKHSGMNTGTTSGWYKPLDEPPKGGHAPIVVRWTIWYQPAPFMNKTWKLLTWWLVATDEDHEEYV